MDDFSLTKGLWKRKGSDEMGVHAYATSVGLAFLWTVALVTAAAGASFAWDFGWALLIGTFVASIVGILLFSFSQNWPISLLGVSILSVSLGLMIGPVVALFELGVVVNALVMTASITFAMSILGIIIPRSLEGLSGFLFGGLIFLIVGGFARIFLALFGFGDSLWFIDWIGAGIFTIYIVYDWNRAMRLPKTLDNAIDASGALILDVVNLFLYLLRIYAASQGSSDD